MSRYPATPAEYERLTNYLAPVAAEHRPAVVRMMFEQVDICPSCSEAVRRCDAPVLRGERLHHLACEGDGQEPIRVQVSDDAEEGGDG